VCVCVCVGVCVSLCVCVCVCVWACGCVCVCVCVCFDLALKSPNPEGIEHVLLLARDGMLLWISNVAFVALRRGQCCGLMKTLSMFFASGVAQAGLSTVIHETIGGHCLPGLQRSDLTAHTCQRWRSKTLRPCSRCLLKKSQGVISALTAVRFDDAGLAL
jgi:hypothetical protein